MTESFSFTVNGRDVTVTAEGSTPLMLALRNDLSLRGTRQGCSEGYCGACTVLVGGRPVTACTLPVEAVAGQPIETIEDFEADAAGKALMAAFMGEQAGQCGYCLSGILMRSKALLRQNDTPTRADVAEALAENFCRCGAHHRIIAAVQRAGARMRGEMTA
jgi:nicotinate dehydrogenase subunit A